MPEPRNESARQIRRISLLIRHRVDKLAGTIGPGPTAYHWRAKPDRRDRFYQPEDAEQLYEEGLAAWYAARGRTKLHRSDFAYRHAAAQIMGRYQGLYEPRRWLQKPILFSTLAAARGATEGDEDHLSGGLYRPEGGSRIDETFAQQDADDWHSYQAGIDAAKEWPELARKATFAAFEEELNRRLTADEWATWRGYCDLPLLALAELTGVRLWTIQRREVDLLVRRVRPLWHELNPGVDLPPELERRHRHDLPANSDFLSPNGRGRSS